MGLIFYYGSGEKKSSYMWSSTKVGAAASSWLGGRWLCNFRGGRAKAERIEIREEELGNWGRGGGCRLGRPKGNGAVSL